MSNVLLLDNFDSFTYNLVDILRSFGQNVLIYRNNSKVYDLMTALEYMEDPIFVISPGPGTPNNAGCLLEMIHQLKGKIPILGICLGHQAIVQAYGGHVYHATNIMHGKSSNITHDEQDMFQNLPNPLAVARYHSLLCKSIPKNLCINAHFKTMVMAVKQPIDRICGLQFHPESILTPNGIELMHNILLWLRKII